MENPYAPPGAVVADIGAPPRASLLRTSVTLIFLAPAAQVVSWIVLPIIDNEFGRALGGPPFNENAVLGFDLVLTFLVILGSAYLAARIAKGRAWAVAMVMAVFGWLVWVVESFSSGNPFSLPIWYELFPTNIGPALLGAYLSNRRYLRTTAR